MVGEVNLSIIIPFFNGEAFVGRLLLSILDSYVSNHSKLSVEVIVIIDSMETEIDVLGGNLPSLAPFISLKLIKNAGNMGVAETRNNGLELSEGYSVLFIDQDDSLHPDFFSNIDFDLLHSYDFILLNGFYCYQGGYRVPMYYLPPAINIKNLILDDFIRSPGQVILRRSFVSRTRFPSPKQYFGSDDKYFYILLFLSSKPRIKYVSSPLYLASMHSENFSHDETQSICSSLELLKVVRKERLPSNIEGYMERSELLLRYRLRSLKGIDCLRGAREYILYKGKINKVIRYVDRLAGHISKRIKR